MASHSQYRTEIDGLRAFAVAPVILYHASITSHNFLLPGGFLGVDVFFVISGFLICGIIQREIADGRFSIRKFYERRARRILPALLFVVLVCIPAALLWMLPVEVEHFAGSILAAATFTSNFYFWGTTNYFSRDAGDLPLLHLWSLSVEEQFYICFPLLLLLVMRKRPRALPIILALLFVLSLALTEWVRRIDPLANFYLLPTRGWELMAGALLTQWRAPIERLKTVGGGVPAGCAAAIGLLAICGSYLRLGDSLSPNLSTLVPVIGTCLVLAFADVTNFCGRVLSIAPLRFIGLISYSAYLWHQPVNVFCHFQTFTPDTAILRSIAVVLSFALAAFSWRFVEQPFRYERAGFDPIRAGAAGLAAMATAAGVLLVGAPSAGERLPTYAQGERLAGKEVVQYANKEIPLFNCDGKLPGAPAVQTCLVGQPGAPVAAVLWGDSYSGALLWGMDAVARERGVAVRAYVTDGCPPLVGLSRDGICDAATHRRVLDAIASVPGQQAVILFGNVRAVLIKSDLRIDGAPLTLDAVRRQLQLTHDQLAAHHKRFILLEQGPRFAEQAATFYLHNRLAGRLDELSVPRSEPERDMRTLDEVSGAFDQVIPTIDLFCGPLLCLARDAQGLVTSDKEHITPRWSLKLADVALGAVLRAPALVKTPVSQVSLPGSSASIAAVRRTSAVARTPIAFRQRDLPNFR
jgi:peptidoglycan/LPS O-acetylase OafA/YrhL